VVDIVRRCYRSFWRLHEDKRILTAGRYYRAADDAPAVTCATYLGSREWTPKKLEQEYGEYGGDQFYDDGTPPHLVPLAQQIGGDCLAHLRPTPTNGNAALVDNGRCVELPSRSICGNVPLNASFSLAYDTGEVTYYRNIPTYLTKATGEGEWTGRVAGLAALARVRVEEDMAGELVWDFALCDNLPLVSIPCVPDALIPASLPVRIISQERTPGGTLVNECTVEGIAVWDGSFFWEHWFPQNFPYPPPGSPIPFSMGCVDGVLSIYADRSYQPVTTLETAPFYAELDWIEVTLTQTFCRPDVLMSNIVRRKVMVGELP